MSEQIELRKLLDERGVEYEVDERNAITKWSTHYGAFVFFARQREGKLLVETTVATEHSVILTPEQAIAATLGSDDEYEAKMDELLCRLTNGKWSKSRAYSLDFMVSCVDEEYEDAYEKEHAELGSGTCEITATATNNLMYPDYMTKWYELSCGHSLTLKGDEAPKWCAVCGKAVEL